MDHEQEFVRAFIVKAKQSRYLSKLASAKHRREFLSRLDHNLDYDSRFSNQIPRSEQTAAAVQATLQALGAPEHCYAIAASADLDGRLLSLREALESVLGMGKGVVLSCVPGKLAYYESEEVNGRYILLRNNAA